jgi:hypothetical protein
MTNLHLHSKQEIHAWHRTVWCDLVFLAKDIVKAKLDCKG